MTTVAQRLCELSGLTGVGAAEHLKHIAGTAGVAGVLLVVASGLASGRAEQHLAAASVSEPRALHASLIARMRLRTWHCPGIRSGWVAVPSLVVWRWEEVNRRWSWRLQFRKFGGVQ